jgi:hypothetical protein
VDERWESEPNIAANATLKRITVAGSGTVADSDWAEAPKGYPAAPLPTDGPKCERQVL